jgi:pyruvate formate lyase activating enzyme
MPTWNHDWRPARFEERLADGAVRCGLSPRRCTMKPGQHGFCGVRANRDGRLVTLNWGKSVHATEETIETEAVLHFAPGERILSMGNIGCMMNCDYCHNWKTSQARHVADADVHRYTPDQVVDIALRHGIRVLSWTYNDPVVWHEFVVETAALARRHGLVNLYKSAFFITPQAIDELLPVMDIFSISVKSMDPAYYRRLTKGWLEPVLEGAQQVFRAGRHLEISTLMVTDISDDLATARQVAAFVGDKLAPTVPLHFVRFHPDYKMTGGQRTPIPRLEAARATAQAMGIAHVYLGNVHGHEGTDTRCACGELLVARYGLNATARGLTADGRCRACGADAHVRLLPAATPAATPSPDPGPHRALHPWRGDLRSLHVQVKNHGAAPAQVCTRRLAVTTATADAAGPWRVLVLAPGESYRFILAQAAPDETGVELAIPDHVASSLHQVFDRAHFPTTVAAAGTLDGDVSPLPGWAAGQGG